MAKIVFMGTPDFAVPTLRALIEHHEVTGVVTQPDRPAGRGGKVRQSPIKQVALEVGIPVFQPEKIRKRDAITELEQWDADAYVVAAFGQILPQRVLDIPQHGSINVHASLLPRWRGAAPIHAAIREGDTHTGITIMVMDAGLDTGPMLSQAALPIRPDETGETLHDKLADLGAKLLIQTLPGYFSGTVKPQPQDDALVTYAPQIEKSEGYIDWTQTSAQIDRHVRAFTPWPGTFTDWDGKTLKILDGATRDTNVGGESGTVISQDNGIGIVTGDGVYLPQTVQLPGKKPTAIAAFLRGYPDIIGAKLGSNTER